MEDAKRSRRSVKEFDANHSMTDAEVIALLSLAVQFPCGVRYPELAFCCGH